MSRDQLITNRNAGPGDLLVMTKKLGTGFITTAMKKNKCSDEVANEALDGMACLNKVASDAAREFSANAATDITGFGLAVHACEMADASGVTLEIELEKLAILPGALELAKAGFITRANETSRQFIMPILKVAPAAN